jgi:hypothetical protein
MTRPLGAGLAVVVLAGFIAPASAWAASSKAECVAANETAQSLRDEEKLADAREQLAVCLESSCPPPVRQDCADRLAEVERATPTVVFELESDVGGDLSHVALKVDGRVVALRLDGAPVTFDPGTHALSFIPDDGARFDETIVVREGQKGRHERIVLHAVEPPTSHPRRTAAFALGAAGVVGVVVGAVLGIVAKSDYDTGVQSGCQDGNPQRCTPLGVAAVDTAHDQALGSTVAFVAGAALVVTGVVLYATDGDGVRVKAIVGRGTLGLGGEF